MVNAEDMANGGEVAGLLAWYLEFCLVDLLAEERSFTLLRSDFGLMVLLSSSGELETTRILAKPQCAEILIF